MNNVSVSGGAKGVRVTVDGKNEQAKEVPAGSSGSFSFESEIHIGVLGLGVETPQGESQGVDGNGG